MTEVLTNTGEIQKNRYDGERLRYELEENGNVVEFLYNRDKVVVETTDNTTIRYIRGYDLISSDSEKAKTYYHYVTDELGSITHITGKDGEILNRYEYDTFGNFTHKEETIENRFGFTGEQYDPVTNLYYLRARFYSPAISRFIQEDTYYGDGLNLYTYCHNNPVTYVDPSGNVCDKKTNKKKGSSSSSLSDRYIDSQGYYYDNVSDYLYGNVHTVSGDSLMYSRNNINGGTIVLSTDPIDLNSFRNTLNYYNQRGRRVNILSGSHGTRDGQSALGSKRFWNRSGNDPDLADRTFYREDVRTAHNYNNVKVYDISRMSEQKFKEILNSSDVTICAWCFSERSKDVIDVIK